MPDDTALVVPSEIPQEPIPVPLPPVPVEDFSGIATVPVTAEQAAILMAPPNEDDIEIRQDGIVYVPWVHLSQRLMKAFGPGGWGLKVHRYGEQDGTVICEGTLYVHDGKGGARFVARTIGECRYIKGNPKMSYASAAEGARSDCLSRCCKDLGVYWQLWDPTFREAWKRKHAIETFDSNAWNQKTKSKGDLVWKKKTPAPPSPSRATTPPLGGTPPAAEPVSPTTPVTPASPGEYVMQTGKTLKGKQLRDVSHSTLLEFSAWAQKTAKTQALHPKVQEDLEAISGYLAAHPAMKGFRQQAVPGPVETPDLDLPDLDLPPEEGGPAGAGGF